jgi:hypothetical protein
MLRENMINLIEAATEKGSLRKLQELPIDIMAWHGGGKSANNECL